jgi:hypothetical protein
MTTERTMDVMAKLMTDLAAAVKAAMKAGLSREDTLQIVMLVVAGIETSEED